MPKFARGNKNLTFKLTSHPEWQKNLGELSIFWKNTSISKIERYQPLADLFEKLEDQPKLAAFFSHVAYGKGEVPKRIFSQIPSTDGWHSNVYGVRVERKVTFLEVLFLVLLQEFEIGEISMRVGVAVAILLVFTGLGFGGGLAIGRATADKQPEKITDRASIAFTPQPSDVPDETEISKKPFSPSTPQAIEPEIDKTTLNNAVKEFDSKTKAAIQDIIENAEKSGNNLAKEQIMEILGLTDLTYNSITKNDIRTKQTWVEAIYTYQKNNSFKNKQLIFDGIINKGGDTANKIQEDLK
jgi:hypothetical protein